MTKSSVLFVCLGNICRSPIAEAVFLNEIKKRGISDQWEVDSAAIGPWHVGKSPDHRALETMEKHNLQYSNKARQIKKNDFHQHDYMFCMDDSNLDDLNRMKPYGAKAKIFLLGEFDTEGNSNIIRDPYYDPGSEGFEQCLQQCERAIDTFFKKLENKEI